MQGNNLGKQSDFLDFLVHMQSCILIVFRQPGREGGGKQVEMCMEGVQQNGVVECCLHGCAFGGGGSKLVMQLERRQARKHCSGLEARFLQRTVK